VPRQSQEAREGGAPRAQLYPDIGVASMLKNQWQAEVAFQIGAVNDREPVAEDDELVVLAAPDPQSARAPAPPPAPALARTGPGASSSQGLAWQTRRRKRSRACMARCRTKWGSLAQPWQQRHATGMQ
jgi:hypothetical protein